jgi:hypothetical protein
VHPPLNGDTLDSLMGTRSADADWEVLPGLPSYGDPALPFSATGLGLHREGFVVRFRHSDGSTWTGNFQRGFGQCETVLPHPNGHAVLVLAGGTAYVIDPSTRQLLRSFGSDIQFVARMPLAPALIVGNGLWFESLPADGKGWRTRRISWDGMRDVRLVDDDHVSGEAYSPLDDSWRPFSVDLNNGGVTGGSYNGPDV